jgi:hypothetical protein
MNEIGSAGKKKPDNTNNKISKTLICRVKMGGMDYMGTTLTSLIEFGEKVKTPKNMVPKNLEYIPPFLPTFTQ